MRTIGLIGGMSWESSSLYYQLINREIRARLGGSHSAKLLLVSFDFQEIEDLQHAGDWAALQKVLYSAGRQLKAAGADGIALCTNTMHKVMDTFADDVGLPFLHIVDALGAEVVRHGHSRVGLLGTRFTMEDGFYARRLEAGFGLEVIVPPPAHRNEVHRIIYEELVRGIVTEESRRVYDDVIAGLVGQGSEAVILGCTEIGLLGNASPRPLYDSTLLHSQAIAEWLVGG